MPGPFAQLTGIPLIGLHLVVPALGAWHADAVLAQAIDVPGPQALILSGSTWTCAVVRAVDFAGERRVRLVGGTGGWRKSVVAKQYASPIGVPTVTVVADAAATVQELPPVLDPSVAPVVGKNYVRQSGAASLVLQDLQNRGVLSWWMDPTGVVQTAPRLPTPIISPFEAEAVRGESGWYRITTEAPGDWQPGSLFAGVTVSGTIARVEHRIDRGEFWTEVLVP